MARIDLIQIRQDTAANWTATNPVLASGEYGIETDTRRIKVGNGAGSWTVLSYSNVVHFVQGTEPTAAKEGDTWTFSGAYTVATTAPAAPALNDFWRNSSAGVVSGIAANGVGRWDGAAWVADTSLVVSNVRVGLTGVYRSGAWVEFSDTLTNSGNNTYLGKESGKSNTGLQSTIAGFRAGRDNTGSFVAAFGHSAARLNSGSDLSAVGYSSSYQNSGAGVSAVGYSSAYQNSGDFLSAVGYSAGQSNTGASVTAIGTSCAQSNTAASVTAMGRLCAQSNSGANLTAAGYISAYQNTGVSVAAVGYSSAFQNAGSQLSAFGESSGSVNAGINLTAHGYYSGYQNVGANATAIGAQSGRSRVMAAPVAISGFTASTLTVVAHGAGGAGTTFMGRIGGTAAPGGMVLATEYVFVVIDANTVALSPSGQTTITSAGTSATLARNTSDQTDGTMVGFNTSVQGQNSIALGANTTGTAANQCMIGNASLTEVRTAASYYGAGFVTVSDRRMKTDIQLVPREAAIAFSKAFKCYDYLRLKDAARIQQEYDNALAAWNERLAKAETDEERATITAEQPQPPATGTDLADEIRFAGPMAQDIQETIAATGYGDFLLETNPSGILEVDILSFNQIIMAGLAYRLEDAGF